MSTTPTEAGRFPLAMIDGHPVVVTNEEETIDTAAAVAHWNGHRVEVLVCDLPPYLARTYGVPAVATILARTGARSFPVDRVGVLAESYVAEKAHEEGPYAAVVTLLLARLLRREPLVTSGVEK